MLRLLHVIFTWFAIACQIWVHMFVLVHPMQYQSYYQKLLTTNYAYCTRFYDLWKFIAAEQAKPIHSFASLHCSEAEHILNIA